MQVLIDILQEPFITKLLIPIKFHKTHIRAEKNKSEQEQLQEEQK